MLKKGRRASKSRPSPPKPEVKRDGMGHAQLRRFAQNFMKKR